MASHHHNPNFPRPESWIPGMRVVVRYLIPEGATDALGTITAIDDDSVTILTRRGEAQVFWRDAVVGKQVPPPPQRRPPTTPPTTEP